MMQTKHVQTSCPKRQLVIFEMLKERADKFRTDRPSTAPPMHTDSLQLLNNLSNWSLHILNSSATQQERSRRLDTCRKMCFEELRLRDECIANWTNQRDLVHLRTLQRLMHREVTPSGECDKLKEELEALCLIHFGKTQVDAVMRW